MKKMLTQTLSKASKILLGTKTQLLSKALTSTSRRVGGTCVLLKNTKCDRNFGYNLIVRSDKPVVVASEQANDLENSQVQEMVKQQALSMNSFYERIGSNSFGEEISSILMAPLDDKDIEVKPDGILYLPEIKYRRILNKAFGPGGWCLVPKSSYKIERGYIIQEYVLICKGQFVSQAVGEQTIDEMGYKTIGSSLEGAKSNALMRCCKDLGIASELWDPSFVISWKAKHVEEVYCEHVLKKNTKKLYRRKDRQISYPWVEKKNNTTFRKETLVTIPDQVSINPEEVEPSMFDQISSQDDTPSSQQQQTGFKFDPKKVIPFGKFKGKMIDDVKNDKDFSSYISFLETKNIQPSYVSALRQYVQATNE